MKKAAKKLSAVAAVIALLCAALTGCGSKMAPADESVGALFELAVKDNTAPMKQLLGFDSDEAVRSAFFEEDSYMELAEGMKEALTNAGVEMTDEDIQELSDSMTSMLNKITYTAEITSSDSSTTVVTLKINGYQVSDIETVLTDAALSMQASLTDEDSMAIMNGDTELFTAYMKSFLNDFLNRLNELEVGSDPVEITVNCEKLAVEVNGKAVAAWLPSDMTEFSDDIESAIFH